MRSLRRKEINQYLLLYFLQYITVLSKLGRTIPLRFACVSLRPPLSLRPPRFLVFLIFDYLRGRHQGTKKDFFLNHMFNKYNFSL
jgi:hypothetical protein